MIHDIADPDWMLDPALAAGFEAIIEQGLAFDALVRPVHLSPLLHLIDHRPIAWLGRGFARLPARLVP